MSVKGGAVSLEGVDADDETQRFYRDPRLMRRLNASLSPEDVDAERYHAIYFAGGHGTVWDLPEAVELQRLVADIYERGGVVSAVCHGPAGLLNVSLPNGRLLIAGKRVAAFTNEEEKAVEKDTVVPFLLQSALEARGARVITAPKFAENVVVDGRLVTGQNPASARGVARAVLQAINRNPGSTAIPPRVPAPVGVEPVFVTLRLRAKDAAVLARHLIQVIPVTRRASGCLSSKTYQDEQDPRAFLLVQQWASVEQRTAYMEWRERRGDLEAFMALLAGPPVVTVARLLDE